MLNNDLSRVDNIANENSVIVDTTGETYENKSWYWKIVSFIKHDADAILTVEQVEKWYYYSKDKWIVKFDSEIIRNYANKEAKLQNFTDEDWVIFNTQRALFILNETKEYNVFSFISEKENIIQKNIWRIISTIKHTCSLPSDYLDYKILHSYVEQWYMSVDDIKQAIEDYVVSIAEKAYIKTKSPLGWREFHDLPEEETLILAYTMKHNLLGNSEIEELKDILEKAWDDLEFFYWEYYKNNLLEIYLGELWL